MISGEGMPIYRQSHETGNLFVQFDIIFPPPNWVPAEKLTLLEKVLPPRPTLPNLQGRTVDEHTFEDVDPNRKFGGGSGPSPMEEDESSGGPSVQCAQQ